MAGSLTSWILFGHMGKANNDKSESDIPKEIEARSVSANLAAAAIDAYSPQELTKSGDIADPIGERAELAGITRKDTQDGAVLVMDSQDRLVCVVDPTGKTLRVKYLEETSFVFDSQHKVSSVDTPDNQHYWIDPNNPKLVNSYFDKPFAGSIEVDQGSGEVTISRNNPAATGERDQLIHHQKFIPDGSAEITYFDDSKKIVFPHGGAACYSPDGKLTKLETANGIVRTLKYAQ